MAWMLTKPIRRHAAQNLLPAMLATLKERRLDLVVTSRHVGRQQRRRLLRDIEGIEIAKGYLEVAYYALRYGVSLYPDRARRKEQSRGHFDGPCVGTADTVCVRCCADKLGAIFVRPKEIHLGSGPMRKVGFINLRFRSCRILWAAAFLLMFPALSELGLRMAFGLGSPPLLQKDSSIGYLFVANQELRRFGHHVQINQYHQRSGPITALPAAGVDRILVIGDSVTFGGVVVNQGETFPALLEQDLRKDHMPAEVLNASAGGWAIGNERAYAERFGAFGSGVAVLEIGSHDLLQETSTGERVGVDSNYPEHNPATALGELLNRYLIPRLLNQEAPFYCECRGQ